MNAANRYLSQVYLPAFNAEFMQPPPENGSAFVPWTGNNLDDILCEQDERTVSADNCISFEGKKLQIPADRYRCHYVLSLIHISEPTRLGMISYAVFCLKKKKKQKKQKHL